MSGGSSSSSSSSSGDTNARNITLVFDECHTRVQTVSELLLISCVPRPVFTTPSDLALIHDNFDGFRDRVIGQLNKMLLLSREVATQSHSKSIHWRQVSHRVKELTTVTVSLLELSAHISYLMAVKDGEGEGGVLANPGPVDSIHRLTQADLDIRFSCQRLKRSRINDLQPHLLVDLCSALTKSLSIMTEVCRRAAEEVQDTYDQDQFKLCVKAITSTVSCLVTSIKSFKRSPSESLLRRVVSFCDPVIAASAALLAFATEDSFIGSPAQLTERASEMYRASLGLSVSISSAIIQMFRAVRDLVHASSSSKRHQDRLSLCVESLTRSSGQLRDMLLSHSFVPNSPHSSHIYEESRHPFVPSSSASLYVGDKGGSSPVASTSGALSQEGERQSSHRDQGLLNSPVSEVKHRQSRLSSSPQQSPKLHTPERHSKHFQSSLSPTSKTPKASKNDKDSSRSPRAKEKRHKSSSSTSSSSSHQSHAGKERLVEGRGDKKQSPGQDSNQYLGADNSGGDNNCLKSNVSERDHERVSEFFFSESSPFSPGSRPTSMDVEVVLASLDPDNSSTHSTANSSSETLPGLRELHLDGAGEDDGGGEESCDL